jgi:hypothetical protein
MPAGTRAPATSSSPPPPSSAGGGPAPTWATDGGMPQPAHGGGAWSQQNGQWVWTPGGTPDPGLESQWGPEAITDPRRNPSGGVNSGAWLQSGHQWVWVWGASPDPSLVSKLGSGALTNPDKEPNGYTIDPGDPDGPGDPPPPYVTPPTVTDSWNGTAPDVTGNVPGSTGGPPVKAPPSHPPYMVSPGGIRDVENVLLGQIDERISDYDNLKSAVAAATNQNLYATAAIKEQLVNTMSNLLLNAGDVLALAGNFTNLLNGAAQNYAKADISSEVPQN